jgi:hypothetical protein
MRISHVQLEKVKTTTVIIELKLDGAYSSNIKSMQNYINAFEI